MKKYDIYQVVSETETREFYNYREAFSKYQRTEESATLYGIAEQGDMSVILSK